MKYFRFVIILLVLPVLVSNTKAHEYYISVTNVEYAKDSKSIQIISQIFIDDFEKLLRQRYDESITIDVNETSEQIEKYMSAYLSDKLKFKVNGTALKFKFVGKEYKDDITYCYLEIENVENIKTLELTNRILFDVFEKQQNIVRLKINSKNKSFLLLPEKDKCVLNF